ncbi:hypothetical protein KA005_50305, partial [bacterium]|nr:hypothetical protein [bacterium]
MIDSPIHTYEIEQDLRVGYYKDSYWRFFRDAWKVIEPQTPLIESWHMKYLSEQLESVLYRVMNKLTRKNDLVINVPPATTKSTLITILFPVWCWIHAPHLKFITVSHDASLANSHAIKSRDVIQSEWFQDLFGHIFRLKIDVNKISEYATDKGGLRVAAGMQSIPIGKHADIFICDDPTNPLKATSLKEMKKVNMIWDRSVSTRMTNPEVSVKIIVMQRLAIIDLSGHCLRKPGNRYRSICMPAKKRGNISPPKLVEMYDKHGGLLAPERLSRKILEDFKEELGTNAYTGQYDQEPVPDGGTLMKSGWIQIRTLKWLEDLAFEEDQDIIWHMWIDGAYTEEVTNDPTGIFIGCRVGPYLFIRFAEWVWMELPELIKHVPELTKINEFGNESKIFVEPKASGLSAAQMLRRHTQLNVIIDKPPRDDKTVRFKACLPF